MIVKGPPDGKMGRKLGLRTSKDQRTINRTRAIKERERGPTKGSVPRFKQEPDDCSRQPQEFQGKETTCHQVTLYKRASTALVGTYSLKCKSQWTMGDNVTDHRKRIATTVYQTSP
ncbi:hypothetical protein [Absidia glauca]|uniref:Uncharacterized protein n=1 Tax=Absidia glauca TaxID=4829 RepID=A0A163IUL8_ABSGL|nr:hypothetical protein [Absidia glauca]